MAGDYYYYLFFFHFAGQSFRSGNEILRQNEFFYEHQNTAEINSCGGKVTVKIVMNFHKVPSIRSRLSYHPHLYLPFMFSKLSKLVSEQKF